MNESITLSEKLKNEEYVSRVFIKNISQGLIRVISALNADERIIVNSILSRSITKPYLDIDVTTDLLKYLAHVLYGRDDEPALKARNILKNGLNNLMINASIAINRADQLLAITNSKKEE